MPRISSYADNDDEDSADLPEDYFEVESIRDGRRFRGRWQFLVKWVGYSENDNSWVFEDDFGDNCLDMIREFKSSRQPKSSPKKLPLKASPTRPSRLKRLRKSVSSLSSSNDQTDSLSEDNLPLSSRLRKRRSPPSSLSSVETFDKALRPRWNATSDKTVIQRRRLHSVASVPSSGQHSLTTEILSSSSISVHPSSVPIPSILTRLDIDKGRRRSSPSATSSGPHLSKTEVLSSSSISVQQPSPQPIPSILTRLDSETSVNSNLTEPITDEEEQQQQPPPDVVQMEVIQAAFAPLDPVAVVDEAANPIVVDTPVATPAPVAAIPASEPVVAEAAAVADISQEDAAVLHSKENESAPGGESQPDAELSDPNADLLQGPSFCRNLVPPDRFPKSVSEICTVMPTLDERGRIELIDHLTFRVGHAEMFVLISTQRPFLRIFEAWLLEAYESGSPLSIVFLRSALTLMSIFPGSKISNYKRLIKVIREWFVVDPICTNLADRVLKQWQYHREISQGKSSSSATPSPTSQAPLPAATRKIRTGRPPLPPSQAAPDSAGVPVSRRTSPPVPVSAVSKPRSAPAMPSPIAGSISHPQAPSEAPAVADVGITDASTTQAHVPCPAAPKTVVVSSSALATPTSDAAMVSSNTLSPATSAMPQDPGVSVVQEPDPVQAPALSRSSASESSLNQVEVEQDHQITYMPSGIDDDFEYLGDDGSDWAATVTIL